MIRTVFTAAAGVLLTVAVLGLVRGKFATGQGEQQPADAGLAGAQVPAGSMAPATPRCRAGETAVLQDFLYFGTDSPAGPVTAQDWTDFLDSTVTPRFPDGLTVWEADGQWRNVDGKLVQEDARVLNLVHPDSPAAEQAISELVALYKERFRQQSVLRVWTAACMSL